MFVIRDGVFETNSSSSDRYGEYDRDFDRRDEDFWETSEPIISSQTVYVYVIFKEGTSDQDRHKALDAIANDEWIMSDLHEHMMESIDKSEDDLEYKNDYVEVKYDDNLIQVDYIFYNGDDVYTGINPTTQDDSRLLEAIKNNLELETIEAVDIRSGALEID